MTRDEMPHFDLIVIGSGPAGKAAAIQAGKLKRRVLVVDRQDRIGGVSVHTGTIPSKTLRETVLNLSGWRERSFYGRSYRAKDEIAAEEGEPSSPGPILTFVVGRQDPDGVLLQAEGREVPRDHEVVGRVGAEVFPERLEDRGGVAAHEERVGPAEDRLAAEGAQARALPRGPAEVEVGEVRDLHA